MTAFSTLATGRRGAKTVSLRKKAIRASGCSLSTDGIRKREDRLLKEIANDCFRILQERREALEPQTVEEVARLIAPACQSLRETLQDGLPLVYALAQATDETLKQRFRQRSLYLMAVVLYRSRRLLEPPADRRDVERTDLLFTGFATVLGQAVFEEHSDRISLLKVLDNLQPFAEDEFFRHLHGLEGSEQIEARWAEWIGSCHPTCTYHRADLLMTACKPHRVVILLEEIDEYLRTPNDEMKDLMDGL